jgi:short-subunit dehydrogenase
MAVLNAGRYGSRVDLSGLTALVTGTSSGIGLATARALARRHVSVLATGLDSPELATLQGAPGVRVLAADLGQDGEIERLLAWAGPVDVLVNNAGFGWYGPLSGMDPGRIADMLRINLAVPLRLTAALAPGMIERGRGHIVNVASIAGYIGVPHEAAYSASKSGLITFSNSARAELAGTGVGLTLVVPAAVDTPFFAQEGRPYDRRVPRLVSPDRVAERLAAAVERGTPEVFVPRWIVFPVRLHGGLPRLFERLARRSW